MRSVLRISSVVRSRVLCSFPHTFQVHRRMAAEATTSTASASSSSSSSSLPSAKDVLDYWFGDLDACASTEEKKALLGSKGKVWWSGGPDMDKFICQQYGPLVKALWEEDSGLLEEWKKSDKSTLAAVVVGDQFTRNMYRGKAQAFAADKKVIELVRFAIEQGYDKSLGKETGAYRHFLYVPHMHSEDLSVQESGVQLYEQFEKEALSDDIWTGLGGATKFMFEHYLVVKEFGRLIWRDAVMGRDTSDEEIAKLRTAHWQSKIGGFLSDEMKRRIGPLDE